MFVVFNFEVFNVLVFLINKVQYIYIYIYIYIYMHESINPSKSKETRGIK